MELPKDIKWMIARHLNYLDTINFLPEDALNSELWKFKCMGLTTDLDPVLQYKILETNNYVDKFEHLEGLKTSHPEIAKLQAEVEKLTQEITTLKKQITKINTVKGKIKAEIENKQTSIYKEYLTSKFLLEREPKYIHCDFIFDPKTHLGALEQILHSKVSAGNIIGLGKQPGGTPACIIFVISVNRDRNEVLWSKSIFLPGCFDDLPDALIGICKTLSWNFADLKKIYNLPFILEGAIHKFIVNVDLSKIKRVSGTGAKSPDSMSTNYKDTNFDSDEDSSE